MKRKQTTFFGVIAVVALTIITTGCPQPEPTPAPDTKPETVTVSSLADLAASLAGLPATSAAAPNTVILPSSVTINTEDTNANGVWATINSTVQTAQKYVTLDLSACSATSNTISGRQSSPSGNDMNSIMNNQYIKGIILPDTLTTIGQYAFANCTNLTSVTIPSSVTTIGSDAFRICSGLTSVTIPSSVNTIGSDAFYGCLVLTSITVDAANANYADEGGVLFNKAQTTLVCYPVGKTGSYSIPSGVTTIGQYAFAYCNLTSVTIPTSVNTIGNSAFYSCTDLTSVTIPSSVNTIENYAFAYCLSLTSVTFGTGSSISESNFSSSMSFPGDLRAKYLAGGAGTYTRPSGSSDTWTKQ